MTAAGSDPERLLDEAIDLTIRLQSDPGNPITLEMIRAWRTRSPQHERLWQRVCDAHGTSGKVLAGQRKSEQRRKLGLTRRNVIIAGAVGLGAAGSAFGPGFLTWVQADHMTPKGEIRGVTLADGSEMTLGPDSAVALAYEATQRRIKLIRGMAFFEVAREPDRPFTVEVGSLMVTALGTAFDVSSDAGTVSISVERGMVEARSPGMDAPNAGRLTAGDWLGFDTETRATHHSRREAGQVAAWRDKLIVAEQESITALVARIARWHQGRVILAAPHIGAERVSGIFDLRHPHRALEAVVHPAGGRVRQVSSILTVISPL